MDAADIEFQKVVMEGLVPKVAGSAVCAAIVPTNEENWLDAKFCVELGVMIMLDKPIVALVQPGAKVPEKLKLVADEIIEADIRTEAGSRLVTERLRKWTRDE
jgi:nucleoside 2-deoxyribosyltransferase